MIYKKDSLGTLEQRFWAKVDKRGEDDCWEWIGGKVGGRWGGYGSIRCGGRIISATHISWFLATGSEVRKGLNILHTCDNPSCVNPKHLWEGTDIENAKDRVKKGRSASGENHGQAKLTQVQVGQIRREYIPYSREFGCYALAKKYDLSRTEMFKIIAGKTWEIG